MRSVIVVILTIYLIGAGIALLPTIRSTPASAMSASVGQEMPYALAWPARLVRDTSIGSDSTVPGPRLRIPRQSGRGFRFDVGHRSDLIPATIPK
jgi:hypothetical protein